MRQKIALLALLFVFFNTIAQNQYFQPGKDWLDTDGKLIEAHGGGILQQANVYYWYGENKSKGNYNKVGVSCYSSKDLLNWKNEGVVLPASAMPKEFNAEITANAICERPKVIYNAKTKKYVMWMHLDNKPYSLASAGIAVADKPTGPFKFQTHKRPIKYDYSPKAQKSPEADPHESELGNTFRDMNLYVDSDSKAYVLYASEDNVTMYIVRLNDQYTDIELPAIEGKTWTRVFINGNREAPAPFKYNGKYYLITSGLTGWAPNPAQYAVSSYILGPYEVKGNPCMGKDAEITFHAQSTFVLAAPNAPSGSFIFMADRWDGAKLDNSRYVWLPFVITDEEIAIRNYEKWDFSIFNFKNEILAQPTATVSSSINTPSLLVWNTVAGADIYHIYKNGKNVASTVATNYTFPVALAERAYNYYVVAQNIVGSVSKPSVPVIYQTGKAKTVNLNELEPDRNKQGWGDLKYNKNMDNGTITIADRLFLSGIGSHAPAETEYYLGGLYNSFAGFVGKTTKKADGEVQFFIYGDGKLLWSSKSMKSDSEASPFSVNVTNVHELKLVTSEGKDGSNYDHVAWCDVVLGVK